MLIKKQLLKFVDECSMLEVSIGKFLDTSVDRSLNGYLNNPTTKRSKCKYNKQLLKFVDDECSMLEVSIGLLPLNFNEPYNLINHRG
ncbi:Neutral ceramidase 1, partial [Mucuna pruriens]